MRRIACPQELDSFIAAGFTKEQVLEVIAIVAASTITNYAGKLSRIRRWKTPSGNRPGRVDGKNGSLGNSSLSCGFDSLTNRRRS